MAVAQPKQKTWRCLLLSPLQKITSISDVATHYKADPGPSGMEIRLRLINMAKQLMFGLMEPGDAASYHLSNAMEVIAVRTLLDLKIFHSIPPQGSMSVENGSMQWLCTAA